MYLERAHPAFLTTYVVFLVVSSQPIKGLKSKYHWSYHLFIADQEFIHYWTHSHCQIILAAKVVSFLNTQYCKEKKMLDPDAQMARQYWNSIILNLYRNWKISSFQKLFFFVYLRKDARTMSIPNQLCPKGEICIM